MPRSSLVSANTDELSYHRSDVQGLRALAVLSVVFYHAGLPVHGGFVGVDVFFAVSGFVITGTLLREYASTGSIHLGNFYKRRFMRLAPTLSLVITFTSVLGMLFLSPFGPQQNTGLTAIGAMMSMANVVIARTTGGYFDAPANSNPLLSTWSLSVEEQFYLFFPILLVLGFFLNSYAKKLRFQNQILLIMSMFLMSLIADLSLNRWSFVGQDLLFGFYSPLTRAWEFAAGAISAFFFMRVQSIPQKLMTAIGTLGIATIFGSVFLITFKTQFFDIPTLPPVLGAVLVLIAGGGGLTPISRLLSIKLLTQIGDASYSIYLWHWPLIVFSNVLWPMHSWISFAAALSAFLPALITYNLVEKPVKQKPFFIAGRFAAIVTLTLGVPLVFAVGLSIGSELSWGSSKLQEFQREVSSPHLMTERGCLPSLVIENPTRCTWNKSGRGESIYLVGDSTADAMSEGVVGASAILRRPVHMVNLPGCPFKNLWMNSPGAPAVRNTEGCRKGYEQAISWLLEQPKGTILLSEMNSWYRNESVAVGLGPNSLSTIPSERVTILEAGLKSTVRQLQDHGFMVVLFHAPPDFRAGKSIDSLLCTSWRFFRGDCEGIVSRTIVDMYQSIERESLVRIAAETGASIVDLRENFCSESTCSAVSFNGQLLFRDAFHLSVSGSKALIPTLVNVLSTANQTRRG
jgi:peptidoglycan/LPS O-acetylase OafA/YrhL